MDSIGKILFALGLAFLMLLKVSAFHMYEHIDEDQSHEECHLCDLAMENQVTELHTSPQIDFPSNVAVTLSNTILNNYSELVIDSSFKLGLFSRPPPTLS